MKQGTLVYDRATDRYDIRFDLDRYYGGLHCGECFDVMVGGKWKPTRIEMAADWYLVGIRTEDLQGLRVRMWCAGIYLNLHPDRIVSDLQKLKQLFYHIFQHFFL